MGVLCVIAVDGSEVANRAARSVPELIDPGAEIILVTVVPPQLNPNEDATGFAGPTVTPHEAERLHSADLIAADAALAAAATALGPAPVRQHVLEGEPGPALCEYVTAAGADLLVVGSHGKGFVASALLGSVSSFAIAQCPCPVLVVPARAH